MAHRGRLNALVHTVGRSYQSILREFEGERSLDALVVDPEGGTGDVKYHLPASGTRVTPAGEIDVTIVPNPSHLEAADPVVEGRARAEQTDRSVGAGIHDPSVALPVLIHGDAAFPGQGVVAETLNLQSLEGYATGGTLHLITNNQVGYTTDPTESRSTRYSSDLAKGFDVPIVHVNADDPEAALSAVRLALAYRTEFGHDFVIDLVGYRRFGHNEQDDASYTQPLMVERIQRQPTVRAVYAARLVEEGAITADEAEALVAEVTATLRVGARAAAEGDRHRPRLLPAVAARARRAATTGDAVVTAVGADRLRALNEQLLTVPDAFTINAKLAKQLERRYETISDGGIDWGQGEALAYATLLEDGIPVRLSGQDAERGTFAHRHLVFHDPYTGETYAPIQHLPAANASFEVYNSPLSEYAALGFEYGYSVAAPDALVLWEAQFGDFVNGAQIVIDQFLVAGRSKWGQTSRLTLLLPHGYEGNGPEHSSARLERFLQQGAQDNIRIANCTTAAQFFHLLRRQALDATARPLVVMTPKGLLRLKNAASTLEELSAGSFHPVIPDPIAGHDVRRLVLCSGKVYYDIVGSRRAAGRDGRRRGAAGAALPVPGRGRRRAHRVVAEPRGDRLGAGRAPEHGRLAVDQASPRRRRPLELVGRRRHLHRPHLACLAERGLPHRAPDRAGPHRPCRARRRPRGLISACEHAAVRRDDAQGPAAAQDAASTIEELSTGAFQPVIPTRPPAPTSQARPLQRQGLLRHRRHDARPGATDVAVARMEQLYPFPVEAARRADRVVAEPRGDRLGPGRAAEHGRLALDQASPRRRRPLQLVGRRRHLHRPHLARLAERGLPDGAPDRAGPHRPGRARRRPRGLMRALAASGGHRGGRCRNLRAVRSRRSRHLGAVSACRIEQQAALGRGQLAPQAVGGEACSHRVSGQQRRHRPPW